MAQLVYSREELLESHDYARPQVVADQLCHGGFVEDGSYVPPRALVREPAIDAWLDALCSRGGELFDADASLLDGKRYPSAAQAKFLLESGLGQSFWNTLTITGKIEGRGRLLAEATFPDLGDVLVEDTSEMGIGHLNGGLLFAHGIDEGGEPDKGIGGHDVMWFALRDLAYGDAIYPDVEPPERIGREETPGRKIPGIPAPHEQIIVFLMNLLIIEFRAELGFASSEELLRDPDLFTERREEAEEAADVVCRIRADEEIHVRSLRLFLGELSNATFKLDDGRKVPGREIIQPLWADMVQWATVEAPKLAAEQQRQMMTERILEDPAGEALLERWNALEDA